MLVTVCAGCGNTSGTGAATTAADNTTAAASETTKGVEELVTEATEYEKETELVLTDPQELVIGVQADPGSMFPGGYPNSGKRTIRSLCYERLFDRMNDGSYAPAIGKSYEYLGDGTYKIEIFDYVKDSKGNDFTASDVLFCWQKYSDVGQDDYCIADMKADDDYTVEVTFSPNNLSCLDTLFALNMFTEAAYTGSGDDMASEPVGTGGYVLTESTVGASYVLELRDDYWQTDEQYINEFNDFKLEKITVNIITDTAAIAVALEKGEIDVSPDVAASDYVNFVNGTEAKEGYGLCLGPDNSFVRVDYNGGPNSPCNDINLRKAIAYAIDSDSCAYSVHGDFGFQCENATNPGLLDSEASLFKADYYPYDPAKAQELLGQSSYNGETLKVLVMPNMNVRPAATLIQQYLAAVGINVELLQYEFAQYSPLKWETTGLEWDIQLQGVSAGDVFVYQSIEELRPRDDIAGENFLYFTDDKLTELYKAVASEETYGIAATEELLDYVEENCYLYGLYYSVKKAVYKDYVHGIFPSANAGAAYYNSAYIQR